MRYALLLVFIAASSCALRKPAHSHAKQNDTHQLDEIRFHYNEKTGRCVDANAVEGFNPVHIEHYFASPVPCRDSEYLYTKTCYLKGQAECVDFTGFDFAPLIDTSYRSMKNWNFRGAKLSGATMALSAVIDSDISGADISRFITGYIYLRGTVDRFTKMPSEGTCKRTENIVRCAN